MKRQELIVLLGIGVVAVLGGVYAERPGSETTARAASAMRRGLADATTPMTDQIIAGGTWLAQPWSMASVGVTPLRSDHPLYRRPPFIGHNRHKVMSEGWSGWYYNPPGEQVL